MKVIILGGGISGLSAAWHLHKKHPRAKITLFEKKEKVGGWIKTKQTGPFLFELGPRTFQVGRCGELLRLIREVGLGEELLYSGSGKRYLLHEGRIASIGSFWPLILRMVLRDLFTKKGNGAEESIGSFATRRFGAEAAEQFFDPMALGVFAGDIKRLSVKSCFPFLTDWEQKHRSIVLAALLQKKSNGLFTIAGGMERLCEEIARQVPMELHLSTTVEEIRNDGVVAAGRFYEADQIFCALPAQAAAQLLKEPCPVRMESLEVVNFGYLGDILPKKGYGYLVPSKEKEKLLGMIWDSSIFPTPGQTKITAMVKGANPVETALDAMSRHLGVENSPDAICHTSAEVPQYDLGHGERIARFEAKTKSKWPKVHLLGNYLHGASVNGCVKKSLIISEI